MRDTNGTVLEEGDRVILTKPMPHYTIGSANPALGSEYFIAGTFKGGKRVQWDSGYKNSYNDDELTIYDDEILMKSTEGKCISIWKREQLR